ncbi:PspA/IM30 family protein [Paenibacillus yanchengensis]|uniref:PspA/IM30 family protein n=1 Tax=Paenibacillus yanchengensis TaxID=2035833 RepID=A0ABW4YR83_9BACL
MSIVRRVRDITVATLNDRLEKAEDPIKLIDQFLWSTRDEIIQAEKLYQQYAAHHNHLKAQWLQADQQKQRREQQALTALKAGEEQLARIALEEKTIVEERAQQYKGLYEQSREQMLDLEEQLRQLRTEYQMVYDKREYYVARMESLRLQQRFNHRYGAQVNQPQPGSMFRRMEDQITDMEYEARSLRELRQGSQASYSDSSPGKSERMNSIIEREMAELKRKLEKEG